MITCNKRKLGESLQLGDVLPPVRQAGAQVTHEGASMIPPLAREGKKTVPKVGFTALSPNNNKDLKFGAWNLLIDRFESTNEARRYRGVHDDTLQFRQL